MKIYRVEHLDSWGIWQTEYLGTDEVAAENRVAILRDGFNRSVHCLVGTVDQWEVENF